MNVKSFLLISIILVFFSLSCVSAEGNFTELQDNVDSHNSTLELDKDYYYRMGYDEITAVNVSNLTVNGNDHKIVSGGDTCINVSGNVTFNDINFVSGNLPIVGSCINLVINNCSFECNQKNLFIDVTSDNVLINNSRFISDMFFNDNDFCKITSKSVFIINSTFIHSEQKTRALELNCDEFKIINSTFTNFGSDYGSAIYTKKGKGSVITSKFTSNIGLMGGAIYSDSQIEIAGCEFTNNTIKNVENQLASGGAIYLKASNSIIRDSKFVSNEANYCAGAIHVIGDNTQIINSSFNDNYGLQGTIYWQGNFGTIKDSTFTNNNAIAVKWMASNGKIINSKFTDNTQYLGNSIVEWYGANGLISESKFSDITINSIKWDALKGKVDKCEFTNNKAGSILWNGREGKLTNSIFTQCKSAVDWYGANGVMNKCIFRKNTNYAVYWSANNGKITNSKFRENNVFSAVLEVECKNCLVDKCEFISNTGRHYGAIKWYSATGKIQNSVFKGNVAKWGDGAIEVGNNYKKICRSNVFSKNTPVELDVIYNIPNNIYYGSGQVMSIKIIKKVSGKPIKNSKVCVSIAQSGSPFAKHYTLKTDSNGIVKIKDISRYKVFDSLYITVNIKLSSKCYWGYDLNYEMDLSKYVYFSHDEQEYEQGFNMKKGRCIIKAPKLSAKFHKNKYFKITLKNKVTKKAQKNFKLKLKVYTGKSSKTVIVKTNKKGIAKFNTKSLSRGSHKVEIKSNSKYYSINKKSTIKIK